MTKFTTKTGTIFEVGPFHSWTAFNGNVITTARVNTFDPKTGHGGSAVMTQAEVEIWRGR